MAPAEMTPRERVLCALSHAEPDRVPLVFGISNAGILPNALGRLGRSLGISDPATFQPGRPRYPVVAEEVLIRLGSDVRPIFDKAPKSMAYLDPTVDMYRDEWGFSRKKIETPTTTYYEIVNHPLANATINDLDCYGWPDLTGFDRFEGLRQEAEQVQRAGYATVGCPDLTNIFELAWYLRGIERFLIDLIDNKKYAHALLGKVLELQKAKLAAYLHEVGEFLDILHLADDIATHRGPFISPRTYREMIKPYQAELFAFVQNRTKAKILYHCCGDIYPLIGDLIEIGVDILNPIQIASGRMGDTARLKREFGNRLAFCGGVDTQSVLPFGSPADVRAEVVRRLQDLAPGGGYLLAAVHNIQDDVPVQNIQTMFQSAEELGHYPMNLSS